MARRRILSLTTLLLAYLTAGLGNAPEKDSTWLEVPIGVIGAASQDILNSAFTRMQAPQSSPYAGLIIKIDTPGGNLENTRAMVKQILGANFPVVAWVGPAGSRAGSAGAFITMAAHVAAMAPSTNIGASHPVSGTGRNIGESGDSGGSEMERKVTNDTIAFIESIAKARGRNIAMARSFVATSVAITDEEALANKIIDLVAPDEDQLLQKIDGRTIELDGGKKVLLATKGAKRVMMERTFRQWLLELLSDPNLFYVLFMGGLIGLSYELTHPGVMLPGVAGTICLILALISMSVLPVSYGAVALILAGVAMMVAEAFVSGFGSLGIGGLVALVLGSVFLVDPNNEMGLRVSWMVIAPGALTVAIAFIGLGFLVLKSRRRPVVSGHAALIGQTGVVLADFSQGAGQIRVAGTIWSAHVSAAGTEIKAGDKVRVAAAQGLELEVVKI